MYFFLKEDFEGLDKQIEQICDKIKEIGQEMGKSCQEGAETFHDNFAFEDGERQQYMWSSRLRELIKIRNNAKVVSPETSSEKVSIGKCATFQDEETGKIQTIRIGSFMIFHDQKNTISYNAPLARLLVGAMINDAREGKVGGKRKAIIILKIE
ncbi:GreA/GreB family elongation factor [Candidatus Azambacteria bacterium]|nr:GreA/GreB family elongation factor [Candidatus Azambacteria bacterium]